MGLVRDAVLHTLREANEPLRACEVRGRVATRLGREVRWSSVKTALITAMDSGRVARLAHGVYVMRGARQRGDETAQPHAFAASAMRSS